MSENTNKIITKETIQRLLKDVKDVIKNPLTENGIYYVHDDTDILTGYAMIVGPEGTPYFGGFYFFKFHYPTDYPHSPPKVTYCTNDGVTRFNPNLYKCGKVCISLLNTWRGEQWTSCQTISTVLLTLCTLLCEDPLLNEPGVSKTSLDLKGYTRVIEYKNIEFSIMQMYKKKSVASISSDVFTVFFSFMKEHLLKNADKIINFLEKNKDVTDTIRTTMYSMITTIHYSGLYKDFVKFILDVRKESGISCEELESVFEKMVDKKEGVEKMDTEKIENNEKDVMKKKSKNSKCAI
jgi:ubiquitin-conjugating enzyme E2 Z